MQRPLVVLLIAVAAWPWSALLALGAAPRDSSSERDHVCMPAYDAPAPALASMPADRKPTHKSERCDGVTDAVAGSARHHAAAANTRLVTIQHAAPTLPLHTLDCASLCRFLI